MRQPLACLLAATAGSLLVSPASYAEDPYVEGEVLVIFKPAVSAASAQTVLGRHSLRLAERFGEISRHHGGEAGLVREKGRSTQELIARLRDDPTVEVVEPNYLRHVFRFTPDDTDFSTLWGLRNTGQPINGVSGTSGTDTQALDAWNLVRPLSGEIVVGVIDTGIDPDHPDLVGNLWTNPGEIAGNNLDDDGNGYIDDVHGYDFVGDTGVLSDSGEHGTHVAGTLAATGRNSQGVIGVAYQARLLTLKVSDDGDTISTSSVIHAMNYAVALKQRGVNLVVLNASYGGGSFSNSEQTAVQALRDAGIILCAAAGNDGTNNDSTPQYPASYTTSNVISVAALTSRNGLAGFSNYGATSVDLAAPGENINSAMPLGLVPGTATVSVGGSSYVAQALEFAGRTTLTGLTRPIHNCGIGNAGEFPAAVNGNIALIQRGTLNFSVKVANAAAAGAVAVIVYDNTTDPLSTGAWTLGEAGDWLPSVRVTKATGETILASLPTSGTVVNYADPALAYQYLDGTSMATPHVAGAVALAAQCYPSETLAQRVARIVNRTTAVTALSGRVKSGGRLNLRSIVDYDNDGLPDWWEEDHFGTTATTGAADADADGFSNLAEFLAGTSPHDAASHLEFASFAAGAGAGGSGADVVVTFATQLDRAYQVEWTDDLLTGIWTGIGGAINGTGATIAITDPGALSRSSRNFYRLRLLDE